ncbi:MAG: IS200/IS605 family transposase [Pseudomonadota bacterium]
MEAKFDSNGHAVFSLNYHLIVVVKYRRKALFSAEILARMKEICEYVGKSHFLEIREMNGESDHVHLLLRTKPHTDLCKYINAMKSATSRLLKKEFPQIRRMIYGDALWSPSYFICTVGGAPLDVLKRYIEQQGAKEVHEK